MTKKQMKLYERACKHVHKTLGGCRDGNICGLELTFEAEKGTWYLQNHGYLDDLAHWGKIPNVLVSNVEDKCSILR